MVVLFVFVGFVVLLLLHSFGCCSWCVWFDASVALLLLSFVLVG